MNVTLIGFLKKEFIQALRDKRMRVVLFGVPLIQMTLFGIAISTEVRNIRLSVYSKPMQKVGERAYASGWFLPVVADRAEEPVALVRDGKAEAVLVAPEDSVSRSIERGDGKIQVLVNSTNIIRARGIESYLKAIIPGAVEQEAGSSLFDVRVLYNPTLESAVFLVPGVMCMVLCVITIVLTSMAVAREKEVGTFETLISAPVSTAEILAGKMIPYIVLGMINIPIMLGAATLFFDVPMRGNVIVLFLATFIFVCTTVSIGTLISTFARTQQQAMMGSFIFLFPAIMLSGIMFPLENMPTYMLATAYFNPLMYFVRLLRNIMLKGGDPSTVIFNMAIMALIAVVCVVICLKRFKRTLQ